MPPITKKTEITSPQNERVVILKTKEEYYESVLANRKLVDTPAVMACTCPSTLCEWHGKCRECVALHRYHHDHVPYCLQSILREKIEALAQTAEMVTAKKEGTPIEYRKYVRERDQEATEGKKNSL